MQIKKKYKRKNKCKTLLYTESEIFILALFNYNAKFITF